MSEKYSVDAYLRVTGVDRFTKAFRDASQSVDGIERTTKKADFSIKNILKTVAGVAAAVGVFNTLRNAVDGAISRYDTLNNFPKVMQQMGFSAGESEKAIERLSDGIQGLPTTLDDVASTAQRIATMTGDLDGAVDTTLALNNAFIASGSDSANAARGLDQYVQMLAKGEVDLQSWRTLQETMGVALNDVAKAFGFAGKSAQNDLYDALKEGHITFDQFNDKLIELSNETGGFADRALTASGGIRTAWTNMNTSIVRGVTNIIAAIDEALSDTRLKSIQNIIETIGKGAFTALDAVARAVGPAISGLASLYGVIQPLLPLITGVIVAFVTFQTGLSVAAALSGKLATVLWLLSNPIHSIGYGFLVLWEIISKNPIVATISILVGLAVAITHLWKTNETFRDIVVSVWEAIQSIVSKTAGVFQSAVNVFNAAIEWLGQSVESAAGYLSQLRESIDIKDVISNVLSPLTTLATLFLGLAGPIGWAIKGFALLVTQTSLFSDATKVLAGDMSFGQFVNNMATQLADLITSMAESATEMISIGSEMITGFVTGISERLPEITLIAVGVITTLVESIATRLPLMLEVGIQIITTLIDTITTLIPTLMQTGVTILTTLIEAIVTNLPLLIEVALQIIITIVETIVTMVPTLIEIGITIVTTLVDAIITMLPLLIDVALTLIMTIVEIIIENVPLLIDAGIQILMALIDGIISILPALVTAAVSTVDTLLSAIIQNLPLIIAAGVKILLALIDGIIKILPSLISTGVQLITALVGIVIKLLPQIINAGVQILLALIRGIIQILPQLISAGIQLITALVGAIIRMLPRLLSAGVQLITALIRGIVQMTSKVISAGWGLVKDLAGGIIDKGKEIYNAAKSVVGEGIDAVKEKAEEFFNAGANIVGSIAKGIRESVGKVTSAIGNVTEKIRGFLPFSPAKEGALRDIMDIQIVQSIAESIKKGERYATAAMAGVTAAIYDEMPQAKGMDIAGQINGIHARSQRQFSYDYTNELNVNRQPARITLLLGNNEFEAFVDDINEVNAINAELRRF